jgi:enoyl-CoA hydratase/carnithine racemase
MQVPDQPPEVASVKLVIEEVCWSLCLARPQKANALTAEMMLALGHAASRAGQAEQPPVLLIRSEAPLAQGRASGAGAVLLALADVVIASEDLVIAAPEMRFGMYPVIVEAVLQSRLPSGLASQLCLGGRHLSAMAACEQGLVTEVLPAADFGSRSNERVDYFLQRTVGLGIARRARLSAEPVRQLLERLPLVAPLMIENYGNDGVRARIAHYLKNLGA